MTDKSLGKVAVSDITLSIGMLSTLGSLYTIPKPNAGAEERTKIVCPDCDTPTQFPSQKYICNDDPTHVHTSGEMAKGKQIDGKIVKLDADALTEARASVLPEKELSLQVHNREDVERYTFPQGNAYVFIPHGSGPLGAILLDVLKKRRDLCLIAKTNIRKQDHLMMVDVELNDQIVVREMLWPEDMKQFPAVPHDKATPKLMAQAEMLLEASVEEFDVHEYKKDSRERIAALVEEAAAGTAPKTKTAAKKQKKASDDDLSAALEAALAAAKKKKSA